MLSGMWNELNWKKASCRPVTARSAAEADAGEVDIAHAVALRAKKRRAPRSNCGGVSTNNIPPAMEKLSMGASPSDQLRQRSRAGLRKIDSPRMRRGRLPIRVNVERVSPADFAKNLPGRS